MAKTHLERVLETSFCSIQNALFTLVEENQRLKAELNKERTEGQRLRDETEVLKDDVLRLVTECKRLERKIKETPTEALCEALEENNRLKAFSAQLELELNAYKLKLDRLKAELADCKEAMKLYRPCNAAYERANEKLEAELEKSGQDCLAVITERDAAEDQLQKIDIALGGSGEWSNNYDCGDEALRRAEALIAELEKHRWIPVNERLPEKTKEDLRPKYLICNEDGPAVQEWRHYTSGWDFDNTTGEPTHWKPIILPENE